MFLSLLFMFAVVTVVLGYFDIFALRNCFVPIGISSGSIALIISTEDTLSVFSDIFAFVALMVLSGVLVFWILLEKYFYIGR